MYMCLNGTGALRDSCGAAAASVGRSGLQRGGSEEREPRRARHLHPGNSTGKRGSLVRKNRPAIITSTSSVMFSSEFVCLFV